VKMRGVKMTED
jgi:hypothetical protein